MWTNLKVLEAAICSLLSARMFPCLLAVLMISTCSRSCVYSLGREVLNLQSWVLAVINTPGPGGSENWRLAILHLVCAIKIYTNVECYTTVCHTTVWVGSYCDQPTWRFKIEDCSYYSVCHAMKINTKVKLSWQFMSHYVTVLFVTLCHCSQTTVTNTW